MSEARVKARTSIGRFHDVKEKVPRQSPAAMMGAGRIGEKTGIAIAAFT